MNTSTLGLAMVSYGFTAHWMSFSYAGIPTVPSAKKALHLSLEQHHQALKTLLCEGRRFPSLRSALTELCGV